MRKRTLKGQFVWRCRRCGSRYEMTPEQFGTDRDLTKPAQLKAQLEEATTGTMVRAHDCRDGGLGVADLQGAE